MRAVEFETNIKNNTIRIPVDYQDLDETRVRVIILTQSAPQKKNNSFNPREFFGLGKLSKQNCNAYLADARSGWN